MQKFKLVWLVVISVSLGLFDGLYFIKNKSNETYEDISIKENSKFLSMMLETEVGSGKYQEITASSWPTYGYTFNSDLSKCENGGTLSWDNTNKKVVMEGNSSDKCYVYFDVINPTLSDYVKSLYTTQGSNNLYLHDSTLTNGANDGSYRYAGSSETTNNFVCFGYDSTDGTCPTDYLYRIIGVFDNQVKLIKYDYSTISLLGSDGCAAMAYYKTDKDGTSKGENTNVYAYHWYTSNYPSNNWDGSCLNNTNLNINFLNNIGSKWEEKISVYNWKIGGNYKTNMYDIPSLVYKVEILNNNTIYEAKIGLMYVSDYGFAAAPSAWNTLLYNPSTDNDYANSDIISANWMYMGLYEWTITPSIDTSIGVFLITSHGNINGSYNSYKNHLAIRPVFYLKSNIVYQNGDGTKDAPIILGE